jgi:hypothetical protein
VATREACCTYPPNGERQQHFTLERPGPQTVVFEITGHQPGRQWFFLTAVVGPCYTNPFCGGALREDGAGFYVNVVASAEDEKP